MHFQYNAFLFGFLLLSLHYWKVGKPHAAAFFFAILLNLKHLFLYVAAAYGLVMLRQFVGFSPTRLITLGFTVAIVFVASLGPFIQQLPQLASRLFPFKRGLTHAYWAPNIWSIYNFVEILGSKFILGKNEHPLTSGIIGENDHQYSFLPNISPQICALLTILITVLGLIKIL